MRSKNDINSILNLLINQLASEVSDRLISTLEESFENKLISTPKSQKLLITTSELAEQLSLSVSTIVKMRKNGLPFIQIGDSIRFDPKVVMQYLITNY